MGKIIKTDNNAVQPIKSEDKCNMHFVSNNEVAVCEHKWIEVTIIDDMPNKRFICAKCGISQTDC